jgi:hypothetical protein
MHRGNERKRAVNLAFTHRFPGNTMGLASSRWFLLLQSQPSHCFKGQRAVKSGSADDAAFVLGNAETVVIVPGYGLAVARAHRQHETCARHFIHIQNDQRACRDVFLNHVQGQLWWHPLEMSCRSNRGATLPLGWV